MIYAPVMVQNVFNLYKVCILEWTVSELKSNENLEPFFKVIQNQNKKT